MNEITTLFTDIGAFFTQSDWSPLVKWPFWILLSTVAAGGIYCARFGKRTLLNQAACSTLTLMIVYLLAAIASVNSPLGRKLFAGLPFLVITEDSISLIDILAPNLNILAPRMLQLMHLALMVSAMELFISNKSIGGWLFTQSLAAVLALTAYTVVTAGIEWIFPALLGRYAFIPLILILAAALLLFCAKFVFTVVLPGGAPTFSTIYKFFTINRGGSLLTVTFFTFLLSILLIAVFHGLGLETLVYAEANNHAMVIILALLIVTLAIFSMLYIDRKKA